jgi:formate dehydrogenase accessory protein FdhE
MTQATVTGVERWARRIERAEALAMIHPDAAGQLRFYAALARWQAETARSLDAALPAPGERPAAPVARDQYPLFRPSTVDPALLVPHSGGLIGVLREGPPPLVAFAALLSDEPALWRRILWAYPAGQLDLLALDTDLPTPLIEIAAQAAWQPLLELLANRDGRIDAGNWYEPYCPFCGGAPVCSYLQQAEPRGQRMLVCSRCLYEWPFRRLRCPECGSEQDGVFSPVQAERYPAMRLDTCENCRCYLKTADEREDGHVVALVDDIATLALDLWAEEQGLHRPAPALVR